MINRLYLRSRQAGCLYRRNTKWPEQLGEILGMKLFFSPSFLKNEGGGSLPPASKWCLPPPPMPEGSLYTAAHAFLSPINDSPSHPHSAHPRVSVRVSCAPPRHLFQQDRQSQGTAMTHLQISLRLLQSIGHSPVIPRGRVR